MAIDENDPRLKDMLRAIELGDLPEDLPPDPEDYDDMGGINSLKRKAPSIKMASETGAEEFDLELGTVIKEYFDLKEQGLIRDISIEEYIDKYLSKKRKSPDMMRASMEENEKEFMRLVEEFMERGFSQQEAIEAARDKLQRKAVAMGGSMRMNYKDGMEDPKGNNPEDLPRGLKMDTTTYPLGQDPRFNDKLINRPDTKGMTILKLKELIEKRKKEKKNLAIGGIAGVL